MCRYNPKKHVGEVNMDDLTYTVEISKIANVLENFGWKVVKQEITETVLILTIKKLLLVIPLPKDANK